MHALRTVALCATLALAAAAASAQEADPSNIPADTEVVTTDSGLKYSVLSRGEGKGLAPKLGDGVSVHYTGWLTDGKQFDSSRDRGQPASFWLGGVIDGWNEGLGLMKVGDRFKLTIPPDLAYGAGGRPPVIPPSSTLVFEVELLSVNACPVFSAFDDEKATDSGKGFLYHVLQAGEGAKPSETDTVEFQLVLRDKDGKPFDSTYARPDPPKAPVSAFNLPFIKDAVLLTPAGGQVRCKSDVKSVLGARAPQGFAPDDAVYLDLTIVSVKAPPKPLPVPEFVLPPDAELKTTESGLKYQVVRPGRPDGKTPKMGQNVTCHYAGWLTNGKNFDSSFKRGEPMTFQLGRVIDGWNEGLQLMQEGAVYRFVIPGNLAYKERGSPPDIGPDATLVFYVELIEVGDAR